MPAPVKQNSESNDKKRPMRPSNINGSCVKPE
jgi:hypothetical protein